MTDLSVVIPAYNEETNVAATLDSVFETVRRLGMEYEIVVVNDGSTDRTGDAVRQAAQRIPNLRLVEHYPNRGYGGALKAGFAAARGDLVALFPADGQFRFDEIDLFLAMIAEADLVCGYRAERRDNLVRRLNGWGWNSVVRLLFGRLCRDVDCGFKLFRRQVLERVAMESDGAMIDTEILAGARAWGFRVAEVPVTHLPRVAGKATGASPVVILNAFRDLLGFRLRLRRQLLQARSQG
jgi:glycosyltransferase involved in cell wall biosynthesis